MTQNSFRFCIACLVMMLVGMPHLVQAQSEEDTPAKDEKAETAEPNVEESNAAGDAAAGKEQAESSEAEEGVATDTSGDVSEEAQKEDAAASAAADNGETGATDQSDDTTTDDKVADDESTTVKTSAADSKVVESKPAEVTADKAGDSGAKSEQDAEDIDIVIEQNRTKNFTAKGVPRTDRVVNIMTTQTARPGSLVLTVDHRAHDSFISKDAGFDYLGLDNGDLKIGLGLRLGLKDYLDFGLYRLSNGTDMFDVYEFDTKVRFFNQDDNFVNTSLRIGASWFVQKDRDDASGFFSQLNIDRRFFGVLLVGTGFAFHTDSTNDRKTYEDNNPSAAVLAYAEWRPIRRFSLNAEMAANVAGYGSKFPIFAFSARVLTHRHSFSLVVANSQYMNADGIVTNSWRAFDKLVFGFQIVREFNLVD